MPSIPKQKTFLEKGRDIVVGVGTAIIVITSYILSRGTGVMTPYVAPAGMVPIPDPKGKGYIYVDPDKKVIM